MNKNDFSFGVVKGKAMQDALNQNDVTCGMSGLKYLYGLYKKTTHDYIKEEIKFCFQTYSEDYILCFGKYKGKSLADIYKLDRTYIEVYLLNDKQNEEIRAIVQYFLKYNKRTNEIEEYNAFQQNKYKMLNNLYQEINSKESDDIIHVISDLGYEISKKGFEKCPFCGYNKKGRFPAYIYKGDQGSYLVGCQKCNTHTNLINFVGSKLGIGYAEAIIWTAQALCIPVNNSIPDEIDLKSIQDKIEKNRKQREDEIIIEEGMLNEFDITSFNLQIDVMHKYFYERGFDIEDAKAMDIRWGSRFNNMGFRNRICFIIRDDTGKIVGINGRTVFSEGEYYEYMIKKLGLNPSLTYDEKVKQINDKGFGYKKYKNNAGLKKSLILYNFNSVIAQDNSKGIIIVEGAFDVLKMVRKHGYPNTVACFQNTLSAGQLYLLYKNYKDERDTFKIYLLIDNDEAGEDGFQRNATNLQSLGFKNIYKVKLKGETKDPCEATKEEVDQAFKNAELVPITMKKKKIYLRNQDTNEKTKIED